MNMNEGVKTAVRTVNLFEAFARRKGPMTLTQVAEALSAPISSCHGLVRTLSAMGYLYTSEQTREIYPTKRLLEIATVIADHDPVLESVVPILEQLRDETQETILLGRRQGQAIIYLDVIEGPQTVRYSAGVGEMKPMHSSAIGKAFLGRLDLGERIALIARLPLDEMTETTITAREALAADIAAGAEKGYFVTRGENVADVMGLATTADIHGDIFGVAIAAPLTRIEPHLEEQAARLLAARDRLEALGGSL
ncbi:MAG: IclR family transcriptional regulator [Alphaproteobacteria bacterium]|nr:IclR family transcriptional regulator [Alphaproteobacteria bacterium]